ncbi:hypothetical protein J6S88_05045 [bacterium]|nr:hypothetical protein [bacterium]
MSLVFLFGLTAGCVVENLLSSNNLLNVAVAKDIKLTEPVKAETKQKEVQKPSVLLFHSKNCSSCTKIRPVWLALQKDFKKEFNFYEIDVDNQKNAPLCIEFLITTIPSIYIEDVPFRNRAYINPAMYGYLPRFEEELSRYLDMRKILKKGME